MNNEHTPGFYILEEYRCTRALETMRHIAKYAPNACEDCVRSLYDYINVMENIDTHHAQKIENVINQAYNKQQHKNTFFQKIIQKLK